MKLNEIQVLVSINELLLEDKLCSFIQYCSRLLSHHSSTVVWLQQRLHVPAEMKIFTNWPFTGKVC